MTLADKIIKLRKKNGWSQEELAERMDISRQAVSKWEAAQSMPDLERVLQLSNLFGVTTDYLLKDTIEEEFTEAVFSEPEAPIRRVSLTQASAYMQWRKKASIFNAVATFLCILSPIPLIILGGVSEIPAFGIGENFAAAAGLVGLLLMVAAAVGIYCFIGFKNSPYEFMDKEPFAIEYGVEEMVWEEQEEYRSTYGKFNIIGTCICILSPIPLFIGMSMENELFMVIMLSATIIAAGVGTVFFIVANIPWRSMEKLLGEGEFIQPGAKRQAS